MVVRHLHLAGLTRYSHASKLQDKLVSALLAYKAHGGLHGSAPDPTLITAEFHPVYTCGRREIGSITAEQREYLTSDTGHGHAEFQEALRGGQTTFHGPGQLIAYPIIDLRRHSISPRCYIHLLESTTMQTCAHYGVSTMRTENPGVWVSEQDKICAVGVHLRRNVTSHGIGLNISTDTSWFSRIVACGLEGKGTTTFELLGVDPVPSISTVANEFVKRFTQGLQQDANETISINEADVP